MSDEKTISTGDASKVDEALADEHALAGEVTAAKSNGPSSDDGRELELLEAQQRVLRVQADLENFRKRARRETEEAIKYSATPLLRDMLPVLDNLQRAIESQQPDAPAKSLLEGVQMVAEQLTAVLDQHHCRVIAAEGEPFDPMQHEALLQQASNQPPGTILQVTQVGYRLHDRVIRPAQVIVSKGTTE